MHARRLSITALFALMCFATACAGELEFNNDDPDSDTTDQTTPTETTASDMPPAADLTDPQPEDMTGDPPDTPADEPDMAPPADMPADPPDMPPVDMGDPPDPMGVPIFMAQGHVGRTIFSCDDGLTWVGDRAYDTEGGAPVCDTPQNVRCYDDSSGCTYVSNREGTCRTANDNCDCDHHPGAGNGITWGNGWFVATWGWGPPGGVFRSRDGMAWEEVISGTTYANVAFGNNTFVTGARSPKVSTDAATWTDGGEADLRSPQGERVGNPRRLAFVDVMGGRFVLYCSVNLVHWA